MRGQLTPPLGEQEEKILGNNLQKSTKPGATIFGAKRGNALIRNQHFNALRGEKDFEI